MTNIKPLQTIRSKWKANASSSQAGDSYRQGVTNPRRSWEEATAAADEARRAGLEAAEQRDAFRRGVQDAGNAKWSRRATTLGPARFRQGIQESESDFESGFMPYHETLSSLTLPPRGPKGSPENLERVRAVTEALHRRKISS